MIRIRGLSYVYALGRSREGRKALDALDLEIPPGTMTILAGPNGSGKSTLFRILSGLALPSAGEVQIGGFDLFSAPARARALLGVVFQSPALDRHLSVEENLSLHGALFGLRGRVLRERITESLSWSGLADRLPDRVGTLSGGLARQVELAKALMSAPSVLLLDEPTTGLDPAARRAFIEQLARLKRERRITILMTSHVFSEAENADRVAILSGGRLLAHDTPGQLCGRLGRNVLVVDTASDEQAAALLPALSEQLGHACVLCGSEIRLELGRDEAPVPLIDAVLRHFRTGITGVAVREPTLEDVFVHLTGSGAALPPFVPKPQLDLAS